MTVTGEYCNKILMALYTVHVSCLHVLHTQVKHTLLHNGNTDRKYEAGQHFEWPHVFHRPCSRTAPLTLPWTYVHTGGLHFFSSVLFHFMYSDERGFENEYTKMGLGCSEYVPRPPAVSRTH